MKIETPKKASKEAQKWEEHMSKKAKAPAKGSSEADITPAKKKQSVAPAMGKVHIAEPARAAEKKEAQKAAKAPAPERATRTRLSRR